MKHENNEGLSNNAESQLQRAESGDSGLQRSAINNYENGSFSSFIKENNQTSSLQSEKLANNNTLGKLDIVNGQASEQNLQSAPSVQKNYSDRNPWAKQQEKLNGHGKPSDKPQTTPNQAGPDDIKPTPHTNFKDQVFSHRSEQKTQERTAPAGDHLRHQPYPRQQPGPVHRPAPIARPSW